MSTPAPGLLVFDAHAAAPRWYKRDHVGEDQLAIDVEDSYRRYGPMVMRRCRRLLGDEENAREATQDTFVQLLRHQERLENKGVSSLLFRMATNVCLNRLRSQGRRPEVPHSELVERIATAPGAERRVTARSVLARVFGGEAESTRASTSTIAVLHLLDGMTLQEVADEVGMSVSGVRKRLRGLKRHVAELSEV